ncbi:MAG: hypothetical protein ACYC1M_13600 [Armatimonadota bacterium]
MIRTRRILTASVPAVAILLGLLIWPGRLAWISMVSFANHYDTLTTFLGYEVVQSATPALWIYASQDLPKTTDFPEPQNKQQADRIWADYKHLYGDRPLYAQLSNYVGGNCMETKVTPAVLQTRRDYVAIMRRGKQLDPTNALYNMKLADYYWDQAVRITDNPHKPKTPILPDRKYRSSLSLVNKGYFEVVNPGYLQQGYDEYKEAMGKQLRRYQTQSAWRKIAKMPGPWLAEQYEKRVMIVDSAMSHFARPQNLDKAVSAFMLQGRSKEATELLKLPPVFRLLTSDGQTTSQMCDDILRVSQTNVRLKSDMALMKGDVSQADRYLGAYKELMKMSFVQSYNERTGYKPHWLSPSLAGNMKVQMAWDTAMIVFAYVLIWCWFRQIGWKLLRRRQKMQPLPPFIASVRVAGAAGLVGLICSLLMLALMSSQVITQGLPIMLVIVATICVMSWLWFRHLYKRHCQQMDISVPSRSSEIVCNWLPVLFGAAIGFLTVVMKRMSGHDPMAFEFNFVPVIGGLLSLAMMVWVMSQKLRTPEYYILANRETQRFVAWLVVFISIGVMPLLVVQEVVLLQRDHTGLGAYKSAELLQTREQAITRECVLQVQRVLKNAER